MQDCPFLMYLFIFHHNIAYLPSCSSFPPTGGSSPCNEARETVVIAEVMMVLWVEVVMMSDRLKRIATERVSWWYFNHDLEMVTIMMIVERRLSQGVENKCK